MRPTIGSLIRSSLRRPAVWMAALVVLAPLAAAAETFTVTLDNGNTITSRYQPKITQDEAKVMLLTEAGNWIALPRDRVVDVVSKVESSGFGRVINTTTISLGFGPNEGDPMADAEAAMDPTTQLLRYLTQRDASSQQQDYSVQQFVDTEAAGRGGFPSTYGGGSFNSGQPGTFIQPGSAIVPAPVPPPSGDGGVQ